MTRALLLVALLAVAANAQDTSFANAADSEAWYLMRDGDTLLIWVKPDTVTAMGVDTIWLGIDINRLTPTELLDALHVWRHLTLCWPLCELKWASPGAAGIVSYAERYRLVRSLGNTPDFLFEFPGEEVVGGDTVWLKVAVPLDGLHRTYQLRYRSWMDDSWYNIPGVIIARDGIEWRKE